MGRINKWSEGALEAAAKMLGTMKNQTAKAQLIKTILDYELRQQERADANKAAGRKRAENKEPTGLRLKVQSLTDQLASGEGSKAKEISDLEARLKDAERTATQLRRDASNANQEADTARRETGGMQGRLKFTNRIIEQFVPALPPEKRNECASEFFQKFKSDAPELLAPLFKSMGLDLISWHSWDTNYGENAELMVEAFACPEKHESGELSLLRLKLSAIGIDVDAINAVRDYRDLKINFAELKERSRAHIAFLKHDGLGLRIDNHIPTNLMPRLTEDALRIASQKMDNEPARKLQWLEVIEKLLQSESGIGSLLTKEMVSARRAVEKF